jgi:hypothetical protein
LLDEKSDRIEPTSILGVVVLAVAAHIKKDPAIDKSGSDAN